jgi:hypothetical protein
MAAAMIDTNNPIAIQANRFSASIRQPAPKRHSAYARRRRRKPRRRQAAFI